MTKKKSLPPKVLKALSSYRRAVAHATFAPGQFALSVDRASAIKSEDRARRHLERCIQEATDEAVRRALEPIHEALNSGNGTYKP